MYKIENKSASAAQFVLTESNSFGNASPFLKWAGGKTQLLPEIRSRVPTKFNRYIEPFLGGAAVFFDLAPQDAILADANVELMNCFQIVRDYPNELLQTIAKFSISEDEYYRVRSLDPLKLSTLSRAARFIFLNKTCFNGLYRVNKAGKFNVPFGKIKSCTLANADAIYSASRVLKSAKLIAKDYLEVLSDFSSRGDFIFLDPPYLPIGKYSDFKRYTKNFFYKEDHIKLANICKELDNRGCKFVLTNSYHPFIALIYSNFNIEKVESYRFINCIGSRRGKIAELIITNF